MHKLDSRFVRVIPFDEAVAASQAAEAAKKEREAETYLRNLEFRARWLDQPQPANVAQLTEDIRHFRRELIGGYQVDFLTIGRDVTRRWWDCMRLLADTVPSMPPIRELTAAEAFVDAIGDGQHVDELKAAADQAMAWCAEQTRPPADPKRSKREPKRGAPQTSNLDADAKLLRDWQAAKRQGSTRADFCRRRGIELKDFIRAQDRVKYHGTIGAE